jgi:hypothetical protein
VTSFTWNVSLRIKRSNKSIFGPGLEHTRNHVPTVIAVRVPGPMQGGGGRGS